MQEENQGIWKPDNKPWLRLDLDWESDPAIERLETMAATRNAVRDLKFAYIQMIVLCSQVGGSLNLNDPGHVHMLCKAWCVKQKKMQDMISIFDSAGLVDHDKLACFNSLGSRRTEYECTRRTERKQNGSMAARKRWHKDNSTADANA